MVVPRAEHAISRRDIDPDALKVLYRLHQHDYIAYLVGGSVRDLLLGRRPKDFDIGTSAHPYQVKKLFRNCWIIGRRFRLAHVRFGTKTIEVATFRRQARRAGEERPPQDEPGRRHRRDPTTCAPTRDRLIHHDNTFGTPEEDAFRRDFTINALFYDIAHVLDHRLRRRPGGSRRAASIRCIGDPDVRFREDPVRMLRAVVLASRLDFTIDEPDPRRHPARTGTRSRAARRRGSSRSIYKILRSGRAEKALRTSRATGLARADHARADAAGRAAVESLAASTRTGSSSKTRPRRSPTRSCRHAARAARPRPAPAALFRRRPGALSSSACCRSRARRRAAAADPRAAAAPARLDAHLRARAALLHRAPFGEALTWLEIHGDHPDVVAHWRELQAQQQRSFPRRRMRQPGTRQTRPSVAADGADGAAAITARGPDDSVTVSIAKNKKTTKITKQSQSLVLRELGELRTLRGDCDRLDSV